MIGALFTVFVVEKYRHWKDSGNIYYVSHLAPVLVLRSLPTKKELGNKHLNSAEFINSFCFGFLSKLQRLMPLAPRKLLSKCPPAHKCIVHGLSWNPTYLSVCRWISVMCDGHRNWMKKDYLWSNTTIDVETEKQILIYLGQWKIEIHKTTLSFLTLI